METQKPSIGRIVHYVSYGSPGGEFQSECRAAIVTRVSSLSTGDVDLCVLNPTGMYFNQGCRYDEGKGPGTWHWPERV